jgi:hypothetical protein
MEEKHHENQECLLEELHELFEFTPPENLRKSLLDLYFNYVTDVPDLHNDFKTFSFDISLNSLKKPRGIERIKRGDSYSCKV